MTELEKQLLSAFNNLQQQHEKQHADFLIVYDNLEKQHADFVTVHNNLLSMFKTTSSENATLRQQVLSLSDRVNNYTNQLHRL